MVEFTKRLMITGAEQRVKKDGVSTYILLHVMGDNGVTMGCMFTGNPNEVMGLEKMIEYDVTFHVSVGKYTRVDIVKIEK